jgi:prepilin-type N-terminal cleavage/methylation domain-containing protein
MKNISKNGFTLIELMIVVAIIGILASIAYPSYQESILKSRRADAKGALLGFANAMERHFTETNSYRKAYLQGCAEERSASQNDALPIVSTSYAMTLIS